MRLHILPLLKKTHKKMLSLSLLEVEYLPPLFGRIYVNTISRSVEVKVRFSAELLKLSTKILQDEAGFSANNSHFRLLRP